MPELPDGWVVVGIKGLQAQSDRMLSIGDGQTQVGVLKVCPKKEKNVNRVARSPDGVVGWTDKATESRQKW